jgi:hypothetical protein
MMHTCNAIRKREVILSKEQQLVIKLQYPGKEDNAITSVPTPKQFYGQIFCRKVKVTLLEHFQGHPYQFPTKWNCDCHPLLLCIRRMCARIHLQEVARFSEKGRDSSARQCPVTPYTVHKTLFLRKQDEKYFSWVYEACKLMKKYTELEGDHAETQRCLMPC